MKLVLIFSFLFSFTAHAACDIQKKCEAFEEASYQCREGKDQGACKRFVGLFRGLLGKNDCKREFDTAPVYDLWYCASLKGAASLDLHYQGLRALKFKTARNLQASKAFKKSLDGHLSK